MGLKSIQVKSSQVYSTQLKMSQIRSGQVRSSQLNTTLTYPRGHPEGPRVALQRRRPVNFGSLASTARPLAAIGTVPCEGGIRRMCVRVSE